MRVSASIVVLLGALPLLLQPALADDAISVELVGSALAGQGRPKLLVRVRQPVARLQLRLDRSDGGKVDRTLSGVKPGERTFELDQPEGTFHYEGTLEARFAKGAPQLMPLSFDASLFGPPKITLGPDAVDTAAHTVTLRADRLLREVRLRVTSDRGEVIADTGEAFPDQKPGEPLVAHWSQLEGQRVLRIDLRATDALGYYQDVQLFPWNVEIPHDDVLFDTGSSELAASEKPKLEAAFAELAKAVQTYGKIAQVALFIAGHTDTVGGSASNASLSDARARAIAAWFRTRGVRFGISYVGLGEGALLVETPDETPEPRNRRVQYIVAVEPPRGFAWKKL